MATIGSIAVAFEADVKDLESGIEGIIDLFDDLSDVVESLSAKFLGLSKQTVAIKVDSSAVAAASKEVDSLLASISNAKPVIKTAVDTQGLKKGADGVKELSEAAKGSKVDVEVDSDDAEKKLDKSKKSLIDFRDAASKAAESMTDWAEQSRGLVKANDRFVQSGQATIGILSNISGVLKTAAAAFSGTGNAIRSVEKVLSGSAGSIEGVVLAAGRARNAYAALTATFAAGRTAIATMGGWTAVSAAMGGSAAATAKVVGSLGASFASAATGIGVYAAIMAATKLATSGMSEEAQGYIQSIASVGAGIAAAAASAQVGAVAFSVISNAIWGSATATEALGKIFSGLGGVAKTAASSVLGSLEGLIAAFSMARVVSGEFTESLKHIGEQTKQIKNMSERFGSTTQQMEVLAFAADAAGVSMGHLAKAQQAFYTNVSKVKVGQLNLPSVTEAKFAFDKLGVSIDDLRNKSPQEVFALVGERLEEVQDAADRTAIAFDLFGKQGANILPALRGLKEAAADAGRLGVETSKVDFKMFDGVDKSFDRLKQASGNLTKAMLVAFAPLQTGWNNLMAELKGGLVAAIGPIRGLMAQATIPMQVFMEVVGRIANILLRLVGVVTRVATAFTDAAALTSAWTALGDIIKFVLGYVEKFVSVLETMASAFASAVNPAIEETTSIFEKLVFVITTFASVIAASAVFSAVMQSFGLTGGAALKIIAAGLMKVNFSAWVGSAVSGLKMLMTSVTQTATAWGARMLFMGATSLSNFLAPFVNAVVGVVTGNAALTVSATATGYSMAAAWVIGTAGLALIGVAIFAVYQNLDKLYAWFADFGNNVGKLFTWDGLVAAATAAFNAIKGAFMSVFNGIKGFFGGIIQGIARALTGVKTPEKINAAQSSVRDVINSRRAQQGAKYDTELRVVGSVGGDVSKIKPPTDDYKGLGDALERTRGGMLGLSLDAAKFGEKGRKAFLEARENYDKLQQALADDTLQKKTIIDENGVKRSETALEAFERQSKEIGDRLKENLKLADVLSPEQLQQSAEQMVKTVEDVMASVRQIGRGQDIGSDLTVDRFFPTSDEVKAAAQGFADEYTSELRRIEEQLQSGGFGQGQEAMKKANEARENAKDKFDRNTSKVKADISFATDIRKQLEEAFLTPVDKFRKELKEIENNKSLQDPEQKAAAIAMKQKQMVESVFGKTAGQSLREKESQFAEASAVRNGKTAFDVASESAEAGGGAARQSAERTKLDIERRKAVGLDINPSQQLKQGADNIADIFDVTGLSLAEIQKKLSPEQFAEYQEALKKNREGVLESLGVEKAGVVRLQELNDKLKDAGATSGEMSQAMRKANESFLSSLGITQTPMEKFQSQIANIAEQFDMAGKPLSEVRKGLAGNAEKLAQFDRAVKEARDNLLQSLGVEKTPQQKFEETMKKIDEAAAKGPENGGITQEEATKARIAATRARNQELGGETANDRAGKFSEQRKNIEEAFGKNGERNQEAFTAAMNNLKKQGPGAEPESPVKKFQESMRELEMMKGSLDKGEFEQRKMNLQAQLQEDMKPAIDSLKPDRRAIESSDVRSKGGVDTFFRILRGNDNPSLKAQLDIARNTKELAELAKEKDAAPIIAQLQGAR